MAPRPGAARPRDIDFSAVGKAGRRTGITLPQQRLDEHGLEEVSNLFSSPRKPSPLKNVINADGFTPPHALSTRQPPRASLLRSASPRKTGISGIARRSNGINVRAISCEPEIPNSEDRDNENALLSSPTRANHSVRRYGDATEKKPLRDITANNTPYSRDKLTRDKLVAGEVGIAASVEDGFAAPPKALHEEVENLQYHVPNDHSGGPIIGDDDDYAPIHVRDSTPIEEPPPQFDDEEADTTFEPQSAFFPKAKANSRRKRKSDLEFPNSTPPKRARKFNPKQLSIERTESAAPEKVDSQETVAESSKARIQPAKKLTGRPTLKAKNTTSRISASHQKQLDEIVDRVRARPNPPKSLYILRRETPADIGVKLTRSGRMSFKPLAYWRNEQCVYGGSPSGVSLRDGARFPLNSIKEIIRTEEIDQPVQKKRSKKGKGKGRSTRSKSKNAEAESSDSESDLEAFDADAEPWETEIGTLRGKVSVWDPEEQAPIDEEEEIDIAYAPAAIETSVVQVKSSQGEEAPSFRYAKLLGNRFMGVGLVDLEPGGIKRPKNSRKMHMSFFVVKGRVSVSVGPAGGDEVGSWSRFSIGKGGFWQVPRGNQYSIENVLEKPARIFFSQGCEVSSGDQG